MENLFLALLVVSVDELMVLCMHVCDHRWQNAFTSVTYCPYKPRFVLGCVSVCVLAYVLECMCWCAYVMCCSLLMA